MARDPNEGISDLQFISEPARWPNVVILPVKKHIATGKMPQMGLVMQPSRELPRLAPHPVVYLGNMWDPELKISDVIEYESLEALVADGWVVD